MKQLQIGRLLRSGIKGCVVGCRVTEMLAPSFGGLVLIPPGEEGGITIYGIIYDIHIDDDGIVRQLVTAENISEDVFLDNRVNRNVPLEISVLFVGHEINGRVSQMLPARPPLTLDKIYQCSDEEMIRFTPTASFGYFRHILREEEIPVADVLAAHFQQATRAHRLAGDSAWLEAASREIITLLRDDYPLLMDVLSSLSDMGLYPSQSRSRDESQR